jgi:type I restriction enzyme S subunit
MQDNGSPDDSNGFVETRNGKIPKAWPLYPLGELAEVGSGVTLGRDLEGTATIDLPYLRVENVQAGFLDLTEIKRVRVRPDEVNRYLLQPGDVLMTEGGDFDKLGRGCVWRGAISPCLHQNHIFRVRPNRVLLEPDFLAVVIGSEYGRRYFLRISKQTTNLATINKTQLRAFPVPCPLLGEQQTITRILHSADAAIGRTEKAIAKARRVGISIVQQFFESGVGRITCADRPGKFLAKGWRLDATGNLLAGEPKNGISPRTEAEPPGFITFSIAAVRDGRVDLLNRVHWKYARVERAVAREFLLRRGDLLIVRGNANPNLIGRCAMVEDIPKDCIYPDILKRIAFLEREDGVIPKFAALAWNHPLVHNQVLKRAKTSNGTLKINSRDVCQIVLPVPPKRSQELLIEAVATADRQIYAMMKSLKTLNRLKRGLMQDLLGGKVRVPAVRCEPQADELPFCSLPATENSNHA